LAQANGGKVPAGSPVYVLYYFRAWDEARRRPILCIEGLGVGLGARPFADGVDVIYYIAQENYPVEYVERDFPLRIERYAVRPDSGGPGFHRGGAGVIRSPGTPSACARMWRGGSSPPAGRARTTASCSTPPRSRSTRRRATRSAGAARASYPSSTGVPASTRQKRAGGPASHDHPRCKETLMRDLVTRMNALCDALPFQTSWYLKDLATGATANRLGDT